MKRDYLAWRIGWGSVGISSVLFLVLGFFFGGFQKITEGANGHWGLIGYYVGTFGLSFFECLDQLALLAFVFGVALAFYGMMRRFGWLARNAKFSEDPLEIFLKAARRVLRVLWELLPAMLLLVVLSLLFGEANGLDKSRLVDIFLINFEHALTGTYLFTALTAFYWPHFIIVFIIGCFLNIATIVILPALVIGYASLRVFRELLLAFSIGMMILVACWLAMPALSPQDRFIDNIYNLPVPAQVAAAVTSYHPQPEIAAFLADVRMKKNGLADLPTTTFPSAHIFWLGLIGYYLFKWKRWAGWIMSPFLAASALGTLLLAQHYLPDVIASAGVVIISISISRSLSSLPPLRRPLKGIFNFVDHRMQ